MASRFVTKETHWRFGRMKDELNQLDVGSSIAWKVAKKTPLVTEASLGEYEAKKGGKGKHAVYATLSFLWHLTGDGSPLRAQITGNATTLITLFDAFEDPPLELAMWRMEIGDEAGPGCCFHIQVLGDRAEPPFPHSLPVPRFPSLPATPMAALEFVLGELFQTQWRERVARGEPAARMWRGIQRPRWQSFLTWQHDLVTRSGHSPWIAMKGFPDSLFVA
jgi:hypothetical protein